MPPDSGTFASINLSGRHSSIKNRKAWLLGWLPIFIGLAGWIASAFSSSDSLDVLRVFGLFTALAISVAVHELAHFVAGRLAGTKPWCLRIGHGQTVFDKQYNSFRLILNWLPYSGAVYPFLHGSRTRQFISLLAAPFANLMLLALFWLIMLGSPKNQEFTAPPMQMVIVNAYMFLTSIIPYFMSSGPNDAVAVINLFRKSHGNTESRKRAHDVTPSWFWYVKEVPADTLLIRYRKALNHPKLTTEQRAEVLDTFVTAVLMYGAAKFLAEADQYSEELLRLQPNEWTSKASRGSVLIEKGGLAMGITMLTEVMTNDSSVLDRAISASFLALAELKQNNRAEALKWLNISRSLDPHCPSMLRVAALLNSSGTKLDCGSQGADSH